MGAASGQLTITSNSSTGATTAISLSGTATAPPVAVAIAVTPTTASTTVGTTQQFAASVSGTTNTAVTWTVSGGGTISSTGLYTAPSAVPSPATAIVKATSVADSTKSASSTVTITPAAVVSTGATYYLSASGSDSNSGLSASTPWLSPNHSVNCGDVILAASGSYSSANFTSGKWGNVSCPAGNNVAWLQCETFDGCKITATTSGQAAISIDKSYWGVQGWEATAGSSMTYSGCFTAMPASGATATIHHIIFANNIANGCQAQGFGSSNRNTTASVDYLTIIGNIAYNASQSNTECYSGISINQPMQSDSAAGTHIYVAGNFSFGNMDPAGCDSGGDTDGEGIIFDTFDNQLGGSSSPYAAIAVAYNNMLLGNGGRGMSIVDNNKAAYATIYVKNNTIWGNNLDTKQTGTWNGELYLQEDSGIIASGNLIATVQTAGANQPYSMVVGQSDGTNQVSGNFAYANNGSSPLSASNTGFAYGSNTLGVNPDFANALAPSAPNCGSATSVPNCMASVVADFTPKTASAVGFGYQIPSATPVSDSLFPQWLCSVELPAGLVTKGCAN